MKLMPSTVQKLLFKLTSSSQYGVAAYYMTFSIDDLYLLIYYQTVDNDQIRVNEDTQGHYAVWDLTADNRVWNPDTIKNLSWRKLNFPNSIYAQYLFYSNILGTEDSKKDAAYYYCYFPNLSKSTPH